MSQLFKVTALAKCVLTVLELNWNQRFWDNKTKLNMCHHMLTSSTQLQNRSLHVVEWTRTSSKCQKKKKKCTCKACKNTVFHCQICKFVRFLLPSSSWLLKFPNREFMNMQRLLQRKRNSKTELDLAIWNFSTIDMLYKMGEVFIPLITEMVLM